MKKTTYTIKEFSEKTGFSPSRLRFYEKEGLLSDVSRNQSGYRTYTKENLEWILFLTKIQQTSISLNDLKEYVSLHQLGASTHQKRLEILKNHRAIIHQKRKDIDDTLEYLDDKIERYQNGSIS